MHSRVMSRVVTNGDVVTVHHNDNLADVLGEHTERARGTRPTSCTRGRVHSFIIGTGEKKWVPNDGLGRSVTAAMVVIGIADVLVASSASGLQMRSSSVKSSFLTSTFSKSPRRRCRLRQQRLGPSSS